ncbi:hypothetical protein SAMN05421684_1311 [Asanoa ishikariensis]|uniref:Uncharacterized protein n=1 Tax=Asanoa ishikariensis TaxID=137265 RepID=A0A1H3MBZ9_9ACTN|nr:hypothetical protein SAMN05421684_1311 [Asanoa ishikariensis]
MGAAHTFTVRNALRYGARVRHLWSLLAGIVAAPLVWILLALGQDGSTSTITTWADTSAFNTARLIEPAVYLAAAGIALGVLATLRWSPLGPLIAGLLLMAPYVGMFIAPLRVRSAVPGGWRLFGDPLQLRLPLDNGTLLFLGLLLAMAAFSVQRWRRWPVATTATATSGVDDTDPDLFAGGFSTDPDSRPPTLAYPPADVPAPRTESFGGTPTAGGSPWSSPPVPYRPDGKAE